ncbi:MAG: CPBP family intramembrane metalloprotease [Chlamydiia bacterium]|nr:CPBP family intramembrane metalloprotease [Chlamydiia bacterium]
MKFLSNAGEIFKGGEASILFFPFILSMSVLLIAYRLKFFRFPYIKPPFKLSFGYPVLLFLIYLGTSFVILPLIFFLLSFFITGQIKGYTSFSAEMIYWLNLLGILIVFGLLVGFCFTIRRDVRLHIFWGRIKKRSFSVLIKSFLMGVLTLVICYPLMALVNEVAGLISLEIWGERGVSQVAVKSLDQAWEYPLLFIFLSLSVVVLVPIIEEVAFRGFLQTWIRRYFGRMGAIIFVAAIFALVHFSISQGRGNFELILSLFVLAFFLGFIYERETTLWAPIGLHVVFNAVTVSVLFLEHLSETVQGLSIH